MSWWSEDQLLEDEIQDINMASESFAAADALEKLVKETLATDDGVDDWDDFS